MPNVFPSAGRQAYQAMFPPLRLSLLAKLGSCLLSGGEAGSQSSARLQDSAVRGSSTSEAGMGATHNNSVNTGTLWPLPWSALPFFAPGMLRRPAFTCFSSSSALKLTPSTLVSVCQ